MVLLENLKHRLGNVPGYIQSKVKGKPFHWTMTRKQMENKKRSFERLSTKGQKNRQSQSRRNFICESLERDGTTNLPQYKNIYRKYCLTNENVNVNQVNLNALDRILRSGNVASSDTTLPLIERPVIPIKTNEDLLREEAEQSINLTKAAQYTESRANRVVRLLHQGQQGTPLTLNQLKNVTNWYSYRPPRTGKRGGSARSRSRSRRIRTRKHRTTH